jgi:hypothetical protein
MLVLDALKGYLALDVRSVIHVMDTDLVAIPEEKSSELHILANKTLGII